MKATRHLCILWSVLSLCLPTCALDTYESPFTRRKGVFELGTPKSKQSGTDDRRSSRRSLPAGTSPLSHLSSRRPYPPPTPRPVRPGEPEAKIQSDFTYLPDVSVTCSTSDFVVRVKPSFYGLGAEAEELKLGRNCKSNGVLWPYGDLLFTYPLTSCDAVREVRFESFVLRLSLHNHEITMSDPSLTVALRLPDLQIRAPL